MEKDDINKAIEVLKDLIHSYGIEKEERDIVSSHFRPRYESHFSSKEGELNTFEVLSLRGCVIENEHRSKALESTISGLKFALKQIEGLNDR